jgi:hypothetical protein
LNGLLGVLGVLAVQFPSYPNVNISRYFQTGILRNGLKGLKLVGDLGLIKVVQYKRIKTITDL